MSTTFNTKIITTKLQRRNSFASNVRVQYEKMFEVIYGQILSGLSIIFFSITRMGKKYKLSLRA